MGVGVFVGELIGDGVGVAVGKVLGVLVDVGTGVAVGVAAGVGAGEAVGACLNLTKNHNKSGIYCRITLQTMVSALTLSTMIQVFPQLENINRYTTGTKQDKVLRKGVFLLSQFIVVLLCMGLLAKETSDDGPVVYRTTPQGTHFLRGYFDGKRILSNGVKSLSAQANLSR